MIDLRSDTVTKPSKEMKEYMINAPLGDDVYKEDPTVNKLEKLVAKLSKKESTLFVPSGTQSNLIALLCHCDRGDEYICGQDAHLYKYEAGGAATLGGIQPQPIEFEKDATLDLKKVKNKIKPLDNHFANTKLLCLENTHHGQALDINYIKKAAAFSKEHKLKLHLDGARLFNALVSKNLKLKEVTKYFDSISVCLSKGLGAPAGSVLIGDKKFIKKARKYRKMLGGGLRQSGILAAAGIYALKNNIKDLEKDHILASFLAKKLSKISDIKIISNHTNMLFIEVVNSDELKAYLKKKGILIGGYDNLRVVIHRDITKEDIEKVVKVFETFYNK